MPFCKYFQFLKKFPKFLVSTNLKNRYLKNGTSKSIFDDMKDGNFHVYMVYPDVAIEKT